MDLALLKELLSIGGSGGGLISLILIIFLYANHFNSFKAEQRNIREELKDIKEEIKSLKATDKSQGERLVVIETEMKNLKKEIDKLG